MLLHLKIPIIILLALLVSLSACDSPAIHSNGKMPPTFSFTGGRFAEYRHLHFFFVHDETTNETIWQISPDRYESGNAENLPVISYGKIPAGWTQKIPAQGEPPSLVKVTFTKRVVPRQIHTWAICGLLFETARSFNWAQHNKRLERTRR